MFKRILVAIDGSPAARRGLEKALELASEQDALVLVLHVIDEFSIAPAVAASSRKLSYRKGFLEALRENGRKLAARAEAQARRAGVQYEILLVDTMGQPPSDAIIAQARLLKADLIVLGTHGRHGLRRLLMGSDAEDVLRRSDVPVLLVRVPERARRAPRASVTSATETGHLKRRIAPATLIESSQ